MIDNIFKEMLDDDMVDYGVILQLWIGIPDTNIKLPPATIIDFAISKLSDNLNPLEEKLLIDLTSANLLNDFEIIEIISKLCSLLEIDARISLRKWRFYTLKNLLNDLDSDPLYALLKISEFWLNWQKVLDDPIPHIYQGVDNKISPQNYYSEENLKQIMDLHKKWMENEKNLLKNGG